MSPMRVESLSAGGEGYVSPFIGPVDYTQTVRLDVSALTTAEVDSGGYLKPGVPLKTDGTLVGSGETALGLSIEPIKIAASNSAADLTAGTDIDVAIATFGQVNRAVAEDILGRAYTADEVAGFPATILLVE